MDWRKSWRRSRTSISRPVSGYKTQGGGLREHKHLQPSLLGQARNAWKTIEPGIKCQNSFYAVMFHDGEMHGVARGKLTVAQHNVFGALRNGSIHWQHFVAHSKQRTERRLNRLAAVNCDVAMQDLLKHLGIGNQTLPVTG